MNVTPDRIRALCDHLHDTLTLAEHPPAPRPDSTGSSAHGGSRPPASIAWLDAKADLHHTLTSWALLIAEEKPAKLDCRPDSMGIAAWIFTHADWLAAHDAAEEAVDEIHAAMMKLRRMHDTTDDRKLVATIAGQSIYANPGEAVKQLPDGTVIDVRVAQQNMFIQALDEALPAYQVAELLTTAYGMDVTAKKIHKLAETDAAKVRRAQEALTRAKATALDPAGHDGTTPLYVVGEVKARLERTKAGQTQKWGIVS